MVIFSVMSKVLRAPMDFCMDFIKRRRHFHAGEVQELMEKGSKVGLKSFKSGDMEIIYEEKGLDKP